MNDSIAIPIRLSLWATFVLGLTIGSMSTTALAEDIADPLKVSSPVMPMTDIRSQPLKDLDGYFPFVPPSDLDAWKFRADELQTRVLVSTGLWPMPGRTPMNPVIHGKVARDGFSIEKVYFESIPGHFVTGFLFRPENSTGRCPGVLCPHGHGGRMQTSSLQEIRQMIVRGEERFEESGRCPKLARCAQLARMGCVVFMFDMLGYADSQQISYELAHRYSEPRPQYADGKTSPDGRWGFYTVQAESRLQTIMGLQTWNAIRSIDFLEQLPDVDPKRIAVTGNSGGGTQTILLGAIDPRPIASFPNGMVSVSMQGGCTCENCSLLRIGTGNVELAALMAPKPQAMTAADDWTIGMMTDGYPQLQQIYGLFGKRENVLCRDMTHFPHNFNYVTRSMMYQWFNKHLDLGLEEPIVEEDWKLLSEEEAAVWNAEHPQPSGGDEHERSVTAFFDEESRKQIEPLVANADSHPKELRSVVGNAWQTIIGRKLPGMTEVERTIVDQTETNGCTVKKDMLRLTSHGEAIPMITITSASSKRNGKLVLWIDGKGKSSLVDKEGAWIPRAKAFLDEGAAIIAVDMFGQGEFTESGTGTEQQRVVKNPRQYAGYTYTYNPTLFIQRVHDVLTLLAFSQSAPWQSEAVTVYGRGGAEPIAAAAVAIAELPIERLLLQNDSFRFDAIKSYRDPYFVPGGVKYGDLPGLLALASSKELASPPKIELEN